MRRPLAALAVAVAGGLATVAAQNAAAPAVQAWPIRDGIHMLVGPGANTTVQVGRDGVFVVDPQTGAVSAQLLAAIRRLSDKPVRFIVNTSGDDDHVGGNEAIAKSGQTLAGGNTRPATVSGTGGAPIFAHENAVNWLSSKGTPVAALPTDSYFIKQKDMFVNGEAVQLLHVTAAHSDGDTMVFFRRSDVICSGAIFDTTTYPRFDFERGGGIAGVLDALNRVIEIAVPGESQEGGTVIVPGRGRLSDQTDAANYRDMVTIVRDRVRDLVQKGRSLDDVKRAKPTLDYDGLFDAQTDGWNGERFVEAIYRDLSRRAR